MKILGIETSCDETALAVLDFGGNNFEILSEQLNSQIDIHKEYGGVYPAVAKREHTKNIYPLLIAALEESQLLIEREEEVEMSADMREHISQLLERDSDNLERILDFYTKYKNPELDVIAVTYGPGLEIALWTGFNMARAISYMWNTPLVPTNHMEGHIYASLMQENKLVIPDFPFLSLLISGGHTELVLADSEHEYKKIGATLDDAVGEAYDKSARLIGIPYPGGPMISKLAEQWNETGTSIELPRPMLHSKDYNFSFSGLKTAVLQKVEKEGELTDQFKQELSYELEKAIAEVLIKKTSDAITEHGISSLVLGGGVSANNNIRSKFTQLCEQEHVELFLPNKRYTGDNAVMIALAGYRRFVNKKYDPAIDRTKGNLSLED